MIVEVFLYGQSIGTVAWNAISKNSTFQYHNNIVKTIEPSPIMMPTEGKIYQTNRNHINFHNLPYLLSDSMPDDFGNMMMKEWLKQKQLSVNEINPVDRLTYVGIRGMGALEYKPINHRENDDNYVDITEIYKVAKKVLNSKAQTIYPDLDKQTLADILRIGTSVGGARAKALIAIENDEDGNIKAIRPGDIIQPEGYDYWLLKIDGANQQSLGETEGMGKIEFAYHILAKQAAINMSDSRLHEEHGRFHFMTKRFDRTDKGEKIHMQSFGALAGIDYKQPKASSYETLFRVMKRLQLPYYQIEQQYRRMLFNIVARNHDDHVKNFSFLMDRDGKWRISPAYDLCFSYSPGGTWTNVHQSSINGKYDNFTKTDIFDFAKTFGIKNPNHILEEIVFAVSQWSSIARDIDISNDKIQYIDKHLRINEFK